jgi:hypothetical protein
MIEPPPGQNVKKRNQTARIQSRKDFCNWLATTIHIDAITKVESGTAQRYVQRPSVRRRAICGSHQSFWIGGNWVNLVIWAIDIGREF